MTWSATDRDSMGRTTAPVESSAVASTSTSLSTARTEINYTGAHVSSALIHGQGGRPAGGPASSAETVL
jgi:hypothetical protein